MKTQLVSFLALTSAFGYSEGKKLLYDPLRVEAFQSYNFTQKLDHYNAKDIRNFT